MRVGLVLGLVSAALAGRAVEPLLFHVKPLDVTVYLIVSGIVGLTTIAAAYVPSRRAGRTDPLAAPSRGLVRGPR